VSRRTRRRSAASEVERQRRRRKLAARRERFYRENKTRFFFLPLAQFRELPWRVRLRLQRETGRAGGRNGERLA
jgi:hypothetical protein